MYWQINHLCVRNKKSIIRVNDRTYISSKCALVGRFLTSVYKSSVIKVIENLLSDHTFEDILHVYFFQDTH